MKLIKLLAAVALVVLSACSSSTGYDAKRCNELAEKVANNDSLTQADYAVMIQQIEAIDSEFAKINSRVGDDIEKREKLMSDETIANMMGYTSVFTYVLSFTDDLDAANTRAWERLQQKFEDRDNQ